MRYICILLFSLNAIGSEAIDKALEAGYKQSGMESNVDSFIRYSENKAEIWGIGSEVAVVGYCYRVIQSKSLRFNVKNNYIEVYRNQISFTYRW